jgi:hypothetical protein
MLSSVRLEERGAGGGGVNSGGAWAILPLYDTVACCWEWTFKARKQIWANSSYYGVGERQLMQLKTIFNVEMLNFS